MCYRNKSPAHRRNLLFSGLYAAEKRLFQIYPKVWYLVSVVRNALFTTSGAINSMMLISIIGCRCPGETASSLWRPRCLLKGGKRRIVYRHFSTLYRVVRHKLFSAEGRRRTCFLLLLSCASLPGTSYRFIAPRGTMQRSFCLPLP